MRHTNRCGLDTAASACRAPCCSICSTAISSSFARGSVSIASSIGGTAPPAHRWNASNRRAELPRSERGAGGGLLGCAVEAPADRVPHELVPGVELELHQDVLHVVL